MLTLFTVFLMFAPQVLILHRAPVEYPREALRKNVQGVVTVEVDINEEGVVADARVVSGPVELRNAALRSVLGWHFSKQMQFPATTQVPVEFQLPPNGPARPVLASRQQIPSKIENEPVRNIRIGGLTGPARDTLLASLPVRQGDMLTADLFGRVAAAAEAFDEHLRVTLIRMDGGVDLDISPRQGEGTFEFGMPGASVPKRIRVGGNVQQAMLVQQPRPVYPAQAKADGIQGLVRLNAIIGTDGHIQTLDVVGGDPALVPAAMQAVREWVYKPTLLNGEPVEVVTQIDVNFTLSQ
jgi:TonB family protein